VYSRSSSSSVSSSLGESALRFGALGLGALGLGALGLGALGLGALGLDSLGLDSLGLCALGLDSLGLGALGLCALGLDSLGLGALGLGASPRSESTYSTISTMVRFAIRNASRDSSMIEPLGALRMMWRVLSYVSRTSARTFTGNDSWTSPARPARSPFPVFRVAITMILASDRFTDGVSFSASSVVRSDSIVFSGAAPFGATIAITRFFPSTERTLTFTPIDSLMASSLPCFLVFWADSPFYARFFLKKRIQFFVNKKNEKRKKEKKKKRKKEKKKKRKK
jgi:hypothetical protein